MTMLRNTRIATKLLIGFGVLIAVTIMMAGMLISAMQDIHRAEDERSAAIATSESFAKYWTSFSSQRQSLLSYLVTADRAGQSRFEQQAKTVAKDHDALSGKVAGDAKANALLKEMQTHHRTWEKTFAAEQIQLMRNYRTVNLARAIEVTGGPQQSVEAFEDAAVRFARDIEDRMNRSRDIQNRALDRVSMTLYVSMAALIFAALGLAFGLGKALAAPIAEMTGKMQELAEGRLDIAIQGGDRRDEIGAMARAVEVFKRNAQDSERLRENERSEQARVRERADRMDRLSRAFDEKMGVGLEEVARSVTQVEDASATMAQNAEQTGSFARSAAERIREASSNIQNVSAATTQLSSSVREISRQMQQAAEASRAAVAEVERTNARVVALNASTESIGQIIQIISDIANQTNLLALNATIEAARAGDMGKGFAVVAGEVKNLANQTAKATEEISAKIGEIQAEMEAAATAVMGIGDVIRRIDELTAAVAASVEEQGNATDEIAKNIEEAANGAHEATEVVQELSHAAEETGTLAADQRGIVAALERNNATLKTDIGAFLDEVRHLYEKG